MSGSIRQRHHLPRILFAALTALLLDAPPSPAGDLRAAIARGSGLAAFDAIEEIAYTFHVKLPEREVSRSWVWAPAADRVTFRPTGDPAGELTYERGALASGSAPERARAADPAFVNDNYWLLFPLRLTWDLSARLVEEPAPAALPIGSGRARRVVVTYPADEGYTPGDVYELFLDAEGRILQWVYRKAGSASPTRVTTWEDWRPAGPLVLSLDRRGADGLFRVWFTDVAVRPKGAAGWIPARP
ncbi:MAG: hypothetical protein WHT06_17080 [Desulfobacterales bacterium]